MNRLTEFSLIYLATPYSRYPAGIDAAFRDAAALAARLLQNGIKVYSPIAHTHPLAIYGNIDPLDHAIWLPFDEAMMTASSALLVAQMRTWEVSRGIAHEIEFFAREEKPVFYLDTVLNRVAETPWEIESWRTRAP